MEFDFQSILDEEKYKERKKIPTSDVLGASLHQIYLERMTVQGTPNTAELFTLMAQHDKQDIANVLAVTTVTIRLIIKSPKYYIYRFKKLVSAVRYIRHVWLAARFRFAVKISSIVARWMKEEEDMRKERSKETVGMRRQRSLEKTAAFDYLSIAAPEELKRKVLLTQYRKLQMEYLARWNAWWKNKRHYETVARGVMMMHPVKRERILASIPKPGPPPEFKWFAALNSLSHGQLFDLSLKLQHGMSTNLMKQQALGGTAPAPAPMPVYESTGLPLPRSRNLSISADLSVDGMQEAVENYAQHYGMQEDDWVAKSMQSVSTLSSEHRKRERAKRLPTGAKQYEHISSRIFSTDDASSSASASAVHPYQSSTLSTRLQAGGKKGATTAGKYHGGKEALLAQTGAPAPQTYEEQIAELKVMPVIGRFKSTSWTQPPRPFPKHFAKPRRGQQKKSDPPTFNKLTPMLQSLCTRGVFTAPDQPAVLPSPWEEARKATREKQRKQAAKSPDSSTAIGLSDVAFSALMTKKRQEGEQTPGRDESLMDNGERERKEHPNSNPSHVSFAPDVKPPGDVFSPLDIDSDNEEEETFGGTNQSHGTSSLSEVSPIRGSDSTGSPSKEGRKKEREAVRNKQKTVNKQNTTSMGAVKRELKDIPSTYCSVRDILRSTKAIQITLGIDPTARRDRNLSSKKEIAAMVEHLSQRHRPHSAMH